MTTSKTLEVIRRLTADEIAARIEAIAEEERTLRVLLRAARARERAAREKLAAGKQGLHRE